MHKKEGKNSPLKFAGPAKFAKTIHFLGSQIDIFSTLVALWLARLLRSFTIFNLCVFSGIATVSDYCQGVHSFSIVGSLLELLLLLVDEPVINNPFGEVVLQRGGAIEEEQSDPRNSVQKKIKTSQWAIRIFQLLGLLSVCLTTRRPAQLPVLDDAAVAAVVAAIRAKNTGFYN